MKVSDSLPSESVFDGLKNQHLEAEVCDKCVYFINEKKK